MFQVDHKYNTCEISIVKYSTIFDMYSDVTISLPSDVFFLMRLISRVWYQSWRTPLLHFLQKSKNVQF